MPPQNRKFLAQKEREDRQKRIIIISTISILVVVFGLIAYGVFDKYVVQPKIPVIEVESYSIYADEFEQQVKWVRRNLILQIDQTIQTFEQLGGTPELFAYFEQQLMTSITQLEQPTQLGFDVVQSLMDDAIIRVEAEKMGIEVSDDDIDLEIQYAFGFFPDGTPTPAPTLEIEPTATLTSLQKSLIPPTPTQVDVSEENQSVLPTNTPQIEPTSVGEPDPTATPLLIPTDYTIDLYEANYQEFLDNVNRDGIKTETVRDIIKMSILRSKMIKAITADVDTNQEHVWIRHILVLDEETALEVVGNLDAGESFVDLASEYSTDTSNLDQGGDLGWFSFGVMIPEFEVAAFELKIGEISEPVQTDFGWHILQSLGKEERQITGQAYDQLLNETFNNWLLEKRVELEPYVNEDWASYVPSEPVLPPQYSQYIQSLTDPQPQLVPEATQE